MVVCKMTLKSCCLLVLFHCRQLFAFDIIGELTFSNSFGFMEAGSDDGSFNQIETALKSAAWM
jgi:hypothetical protein